jgi:pre-mRNA-processing factor 39
MAGSYDSALRVYESLEESVPGLAMVSLRRLGMERRQGNQENVHKLYKELIERSKGQVKTFYAIKYARFLSKVSIHVFCYFK